DTSCVLYRTTSVVICSICCLASYFLFFFFSSRRRHTRLVSDWSSDVCSSDLRLLHASAFLGFASTARRYFSMDHRASSFGVGVNLASSPRSTSALSGRSFFLSAAGGYRGRCPSRPLPPHRSPVRPQAPTLHPR